MRSKKAFFILAGASGFLACVLALADTMKPRVVERSEFTLVGIEARTTNAKELTSDGVILKQWARFMQERILDKIHHRTDSTVLALHTDYASDRNGEYIYLLGARVTDSSLVPQGMVMKKVPASQYAIITSEKGPAGKVVAETWQHIWSLEDRGQLGGHRTCRADFEVYDQRHQDLQSSQIDVFVGINWATPTRNW
jgi:predicted transcriptional regulator YdeE